ncbi:MAG TPA: hypothetical protein VMV69_00555 [Pirellulales bacterium]|nr:hypothetical protein [Pirellulales bacterium]
MKISEILHRDPAAHGLVNQGQARIADRPGEKELLELRGELSTFVCEGQFADGIQKILRSFLDNLGRSSQKGAWVSGFFGSGKSHELKMLCHLWQNTAFADGATARSLVPQIPDDIEALLRELDIEFLVTLFQAKYAHKKLTGDANFPQTGVEKMIQAVRCLFDPNAAITTNVNLTVRIEEIRSLIRDGQIPRVRAVLCNNGLRWPRTATQIMDAAGFFGRASAVGACQS